MPLLSLSLSSLDFLISRLTAPPNGRPSHISKLPNDTFVDHVSGYLDVYDILRLRRVCKLYYYLTHHTAIWKRFLQRIDVPLPHVPPTARYSFENLNGLEAERLVLRAISLNKCWKSIKPRYKSYWTFPAHHDVLSMTILPGGHYLVASVADESRMNTSIAIFVMDSQLAGAYIVARYHLATKAFHLQAKYMTVQGERGIVISYVRRDYRYQSDIGRGININMYSADHEIDPEVPLTYECGVLHVSLSSLEILSDPRLKPNSSEFLEYAKAQAPPFRPLATIETRSVLGIPALDEIFGSPYLAIPKDRNMIIFKRLDGGNGSTLICRPTDAGPIEEHEIVAIRLVSTGNKVLVVRKITQGDPKLSIEYFDVLPCRDEPVEVARHYTEAVVMNHTDASTVRISDHGIPPRHDDSVVPSLSNRPGVYSPRPIAIYACMKDGNAIMRLTLFPKRDPDKLPPELPVDAPAHAGPLLHAINYGAYSYPLSENSGISCLPWADARTQLRCLPGSYRAILYTVPRGDRTDSPRIVDYFRYFVQKTLVAEVRDDIIGPAARFKAPAEITNQNSIHALAWEETIGRLCVVGDNHTTVHVVDFAASPLLKVTKKGRERWPIPLNIDPDPDAIIPPLPLPRQSDANGESNNEDMNID